LGFSLTGWAKSSAAPGGGVQAWGTVALETEVAAEK